MGGESSGSGGEGHQGDLRVSSRNTIEADDSILAKAGVVEEQDGLQVDTFVNTSVAKLV